MKKLTLLSALLLTVFCAIAQKAWFVSVVPGMGIGGPMGSIKKNMEKNNFNQRSSDVDFFGIQFEGSDYPQISHGIAILVKAGKKITDNRTVYVEAGIANRGEITGNRNTGYSETRLPITYKVLQFTAACQFSHPGHGAKLGIGPSLYLFQYKAGYEGVNQKTYSSAVPGVASMVRLPLGREKKLIGIEFVLEANLAPPAHMEKIVVETPNYFTLPKSNVNMISGVIGFALRLAH